MDGWTDGRPIRKMAVIQTTGGEASSSYSRSTESFFDHDHEPDDDDPPRSIIVK